MFFYTVADNLGIRKLMEYAKNFGLGESTGIELSETTGNMANPDNHLNYDVDSWVDGDTVQAGIGQSDSMIHAAAARRVLRRHRQRRHAPLRRHPQERPQLRLLAPALSEGDRGALHR